jgi:hypothetical protein
VPFIVMLVSVTFVAAFVSTVGAGPDRGHS